MEKLYNAIKYLDFFIAHVQDNTDFISSDNYMVSIKPSSDLCFALSYSMCLNRLKLNFKEHNVTYEYNSFTELYELKFRRKHLGGK